MNPTPGSRQEGAQAAGAVRLAHGNPPGWSPMLCRVRYVVLGPSREGGLQQQARHDVGVHVGGGPAVLQVALVLQLHAPGTRSSPADY